MHGHENDWSANILEPFTYYCSITVTIVGEQEFGNVLGWRKNSLRTSRKFPPFSQQTFCLREQIRGKNATKLLEYQLAMGCSRKDPYPPPPMEEINNTPLPSLLCKFKTFFRQFPSPPPSLMDGRNFLYGWDMDLFWNDSIIFGTVSACLSYLHIIS